MSLGPDDLPEDPFGESGMAQLVCGCTSELFRFVFTETTVRAVCAKCDTIAGEYPKGPQVYQPWGGDLGQPSSAPEVTPGRDMLSRPKVSAAWDTPPPGPAPEKVEADLADHGITPDPPALPSYSAGMCNTYLEGGDYDGQITWLMAGTQKFEVSGMSGTYWATAAVRDGRVVYRFEEAGHG
jgi:hypothetical protein